MKRVVPVVGLLVVVLGGLIVWKIRSQNAALEGPPSGSGVIESVGVDLSSRMAARVIEVHADEGATVAAGDLVIELDCAEPNAVLAEAAARLEAARAQAEGAHAQADAATNQSQAARANIGALGARTNALDAQRGVAEREAERVESMGTYAAAARQDQARTAAVGLEAETRAARAQVSASRRNADAANSQASAAESAATAADRSVTAIEAVVARAEIAVSECRIVAPRRGVVERVFYEPGELVMPGSVVARIVDPARVEITFYVPNADVDEAHVDMEATVEADAYPGRRFAARVHRVGLEAEFTPRNIQTRSDRDRLVFPVEVRLENDEGLLRPGMPVVVTLSAGGEGASSRREGLVATRYALAAPESCNE